MSGWSFHVVLAASVVAHAVAMYASPVGAMRRTAPPAEMQWVRMPPPPEPKPEPEPELTEAPTVAPTAAPSTRVSRARPTSPTPSSAPPAEPTAVPDAPVVLAGVTLTSGVGVDGWAPVGDGSVPTGPARAPRAAGGAGGPHEQGPVNVGAPVVPVEDLARPPRPPELADALRAAYPPDERRLGQTGEAVVQLRIASDGRVGRVTVLASSTPSFGDACRDVLRTSRWDAPVDVHGASVATIVRYRCRFETR